ncbi:PH domain-containing protein [Qipengyuania zhejiangensis]|uniref:PH domain-containing protein n=1 Tax=Qipengyuania zhejiangensis TaxID=3077782 RepID=UPI002D7908D2|nr:PH domain-containing protein [Qipengyuania sp. Z2]
MTDHPAGMARRTDPRTFAVKAATMLTQLVVPVAIGAVTIFDKGDFGDVAAFYLPLVLLVIAANFAVAYLRWSRLTYEVRESDIRVESGLLSRTARAIPYERIQDVSLEQKFLPRLFGLTEVKFETGAGGGDDLKLAYLSEDEGERLRKVVRYRRDGGVEPDGQAGAADHDEEAAEVLFAMTPGRVLKFGLFEFSLAVVAVIGGAAQQLDFLLPFDLWDLDAWQERIAGPGRWLAGLGVAAQIIGAAVALVFLAVLGLATGLVRTALREWNFRLERGEKGLRRRRGLITRTDVVMPLHRVQALRLGTGFVRRLFGWHSLKVVSLASDSGSANHDAAPFAQMDEIAPIVATTGFALPDSGLPWGRRSARASFDAAMMELALFTMAAVPAYVFSPYPLIALLPLAAGLVAAIRQYYLYRVDRHALGAQFLYSRHGWLSPKTTIGSRIRLQSVEIRQGPLARRRGYAALHLGLAGGTFEIAAMDVADARRWRAEILESIAGTDFSRLVGPVGDPEVSGP